jgi:hypothetical protein
VTDLPTGPVRGIADDEDESYEFPPDECEHGVPIEYACEQCERVRHGEPGQVPVSAGDVEAGALEFSYLATHGPDSTRQFLDSATLSPSDARRATGLCARSPLELLGGIAEASRQRAADFSVAGPVVMFATLANIADRLNHGERPYVHHQSGRPWSFRVHVSILGKTRRGKGVQLDFHTLWAQAVLGHDRVRQIARASMAGLFGTAPGEDGKAAAEGEVVASRHGILIFPEFENARSLFGGPRGTESAGVFSDWLSSGTYAYALKRGRAGYTSFAYLLVAAQLAVWDSVASSVLGLAGRFVLCELGPLDRERIREQLTADALGHALDPVALAVLSAKISRIEAEFRPDYIDISAVQRRLLDLIELELPGRVYDLDDLQRHVAICMGAYLATGGALAGPVVLPDPWSVPELRAALEEDGRVRALISSDPGERLVRRIDDELARSGFATTTPRSRDELVIFISQRLGESPNSVRNAVVGHRGRDGAYAGFEARKILREVSPEIDEAKRALEAAQAAGPAPQAQAVYSRVLAEHRARGGRPARLFVYMSAAERVFTTLKTGREDPEE